MTNFGRAEYTVGANVDQALQGLSRVERELIRLGAVVEKSVGGAMVVSFSKAGQALSSLVPVSSKVNTELQKMGLVVKQTMGEFADFKIGEGFEGDLASKVEEALKAIKSLSTQDPFGNVMREGRSFQAALSEVIQTIRDLEAEEKRLQQTQQLIKDGPFVGPGWQTALDSTEVKLRRIRESLERLGKASKEASSRPLGLIEGQTAASETGQLFETEDLDGGRAAAEDLLQTFQELNAESRVLAGAFGDIEAPQLKATQQSFDDLAKSEQQVVRLTEQLSQAAQKATLDTLGNSAKKSVGSLQELQRVVEKLEQELKQLQTLAAKQQAGQGFVSPQVATAMQKVKDQAKGLGVQLGLTHRELNKFGQEGGGKIAGFLRNLSGSFDRFGQSIEDATGIAESDFAILLGAGLAGGFAGVLRIVEKATRAIIQFATEQSFLDRQTRLTFGGAASEIEAFAASTARSLGVSETEALQTANAFARLAAETRLTGDAAVEFAQNMTAATAAIEASYPGFRTTEEAQQAVQAALSGSSEALNRFGISLADLNDIAQENFGGRLYQQLSELEQQWVRSIAVQDAAAEGLEKYGAGTLTITDRLRDFQKVVGDFFSAINRGTIDEDPFTSARAAMEELIQVGESGRLENAFSGLKSGGIFGGIFGFFQGGSLDQFKASVQGLSKDQLEFMRRAAENNITDKKLREEVLKIIDAQTKALEEHVRQLNQGKSELEIQAELHAKNLETFREDINLQRQAADAQRALQEAIFDGNRRIEEAEIRLQRTREDNARKYRDLQIQSSRAIEDAVTRVQSAQLELIDNQNDASDRIEDAIDRIADAKKEAERSVRDINERIEDRELSHSRKVEDLQRDIAKAHKEKSQSVIESEIDMFEALRRGDLQAFNAAAREVARQKDSQEGTERIADLERELARERQDYSREIDRLERDREEARLDGVEALRRAERDRARAQRDNLVLIAKAQLQLDQAIREEVRAREDAIRALNDLEVEQNRALFDARRALEEAEIQRERAVNSAIRAFERLAENIGLRVDEIIRELARLIPNGATVAMITGGFSGGLAAGGPTNPYQSYIVGERGPEMFVPGQYGTVVPNWKLQQLIMQLLQSGIYGPPGTIGGRDPSSPMGNEIVNRPTVNIYESTNPRTTAWYVSRLLGSQVRN